MNFKIGYRVKNSYDKGDEATGTVVPFVKGYHYDEELPGYVAVKHDDGFNSYGQPDCYVLVEAKNYSNPEFKKLWDDIV